MTKKKIVTCADDEFLVLDPRCLKRVSGMRRTRALLQGCCRAALRYARDDETGQRVTDASTSQTIADALRC